MAEGSAVAEGAEGPDGAAGAMSGPPQAVASGPRLTAKKRAIDESFVLLPDRKCSSVQKVVLGKAAFRLGRQWSKSDRSAASPFLRANPIGNHRQPFVRRA